VALALECVIGAAASSPISSAPPPELAVARDSLVAALSNADAALRAGEDALASCSDPRARQVAAAQLSGARNAIDLRRNTANSLTGYLDAADPRGQILLSAVESIRLRVDEELDRAEPDLVAFDQALKNQLQTAASAYTSAQPQTPAAPPPAAPAPELNSVENIALSECPPLQNRIDALNSAVAEIDLANNAVAKALTKTTSVPIYPADLFTNCSLNNPIGKGPLRTNPAEQPVAPGAAAVLQTVITGGRRPYRIQTDALPAGVTPKLASATEDGQMMQVDVTAAAAKAGTPPLVVIVKDAADTSATYVVRVPAAGSSGDGGRPGPAAPAAAPAATTGEVFDPAVERVQKSLKDLATTHPEYDPGKVDGKWGEDTRKAVVAFLNANSEEDPKPDFEHMDKKALLAAATDSKMGL